MLRVADILKQKGPRVWSLDTSGTIRDALKLLAEKDIGALLILDGKKVAGIFSERDFARALANKKSVPLDTLVAELMTQPVLTVSPNDQIEQCMQLITDRHIRHLPVIENDELVGLISIGDVVKALISQQKSFIQQLQDYIGGRW